MPLSINKSWTLFLDRDGVINERLPDDYVKNIEQLTLIPGTLEAISIFTTVFGRIIIVSNQQGIGKGLMTMKDLDEIHKSLIQKVESSGGNIDKIYVSPYLKSENHFTRKPSVGMAVMARREFPEISFRKSLMVGDSISDMIFGKRMGMVTVFIGDPTFSRKHFKLIDYTFRDLLNFAQFISFLQKKQN